MKLNFNKKNWQKVKFGDLVVQQKESISIEDRQLGDRYIAGEHMDTEDIHIRRWGEIDGSYLGPAFHRTFKKGDILYGSRRTYLKKVAVAHFDGITSNTTFVIRPNEEIIDPRLVPFLMLSDKFTQHSIKNSKGSVNPYINFKDIAKFELLIPPLDEQKKLADLLWAGDSLIENYIYSHEELFIFFKTKLFNHFSNKNLDQIEIGKVGKVVTGKTPSTSNQKAWNGDVPFVTPSDLKEGQKYFEKTERTVNSSYVEKYLLPENSILVTCIASIGQISISNQIVCTNQQINSIIPTLIEDAEFIYYSILAKMHSFKRIAGTSVVPIINKSTFEKFKINYTSNKNVKAKVVEDLRMLEKVMNFTKRTIQKSRKLNKKIIDDIFS